jgi:hypothetical protein
MTPRFHIAATILLLAVTWGCAGWLVWLMVD